MAEGDEYLTLMGDGGVAKTQYGTPQGGNWTWGTYTAPAPAVDSNGGETSFDGQLTLYRQPASAQTFDSVTEDDSITLRGTPTGSEPKTGGSQGASTTIPSDPVTSQTGSPTGDGSNPTGVPTTNNNNNEQKDELSSEQKARLAKQAKKRADATSSAYTTGNFFNVRYVQLDEKYGDQHFITTKGGKILRVICYLAPKVHIDNDLRFSPNMDENLAVPLILGAGADKVVLNDRLDEMGMSGYIEAKDSFGYLGMYLTRYHNFFVVVNISQKINGGIVHYEPYIFDITKVQQTSSSQSNQKQIIIHMIDCMTSVMKSHTIASVIKFNQSITSASSYKQVFSIILQYIKNYLRINTNVTSQFRKDLLYNDGVLLKGHPANGYDRQGDMSSLVKHSFAKMNRNATIYEAFDILTKDCCTSLKVPKKFSEGYESIGDVLMPFYFKEEYPDEKGIYHLTWIDTEVIEGAKDDKDDKTVNADGQSWGAGAAGQSGTGATTDGNNDGTQSPSVDSAAPPQKPDTHQTRDTQSDDSNKPTGGSDSAMDSSGKPTQQQSTTAKVTNTQGKTDGQAQTHQGATSKKLQQLYNHFDDIMIQQTKTNKKVLMRQMTMRDFYMPFCLAFGNDTPDEYGVIYEIYNPNEHDISSYGTINGVYNNKSLYNMTYTPMQLHTVADKWKNVVFIDCSSDGSGGSSTLIFFSWFYDYYNQVFLNSKKKKYKTNVSPDFYTVSKNEKIGHAKKMQPTFDSLFDEYNACTYATQTDDTVGECLRHMGKNIASFILLNDIYTFNMDGNMLRRPNEIVRLGVDKRNDGSKNMLEIATDILQNPFVMLYIRQVTHIFTPTNYQNKLDCCKICQYGL